MGRGGGRRVEGGGWRGSRLQHQDGQPIGPGVGAEQHAENADACREDGEVEASWGSTNNNMKCWNMCENKLRKQKLGRPTPSQKRMSAFSYSPGVAASTPGTDTGPSAREPAAKRHVRPSDVKVSAAAGAAAFCTILEKKQKFRKQTKMQMCKNVYKLQSTFLWAETKNRASFEDLKGILR